MTMQKIHIIKDTHKKQFTSIGYNPLKHEMLTGFEDGCIKTWDCVGDNIGVADSNSKQSKVYYEHHGWVNCFLYWAEQKLMLSAANDGKIIAWGSSMIPAFTVKIGLPIYAMAWNIRRNQLVLGMNSAVRVYTLCDPNKEGKFLSDKAFITKDHNDLVSAIVCYETRVYSAGFDRRICIYESYAYPEKNGLKLVSSLYPAHDAGITILNLAKDNENNTWLLSGSFDKSVKIWSQDGQLMHKFDGFSDCVTGLCYVAPTKTVWVAAGDSQIPMFDPKSGDNVSDFIGTFQSRDEEKYSVLHLLFIADLNQVVATDTKRQISIWKHNPTGCITALRHKNPVESLTYTVKVPLLIFSGDNMGDIHKWERLQSNTFMYSKETLPRSEAMSQLMSQFADEYSYSCARNCQNTNSAMNSSQNLSTSREDFKQTYGRNEQANIAVMKLLFVEELDLLLVACEDNNIYVWGFDYKAVEVLQKMKPKEDVLTNKFAFLLKHSNKDNITDLPSTSVSIENDSVANRVAGFICKSVFTHHTQCVSGLAAVVRPTEFQSVFLVSTGWDRKLLIWDLEKLTFHDAFRQDIHKKNEKSKRTEDWDLASDGIITDLVYSEERNEIAYSSSDKLVYIRKFSPRAHEMKLTAVLQGHEAEVSHVRWSSKHKKWVTGSEDNTIRVWSADGLSCETIFSTHGIVSAMCLDETNGCIVAGVQDVLRIYDMKSKRLLQKNVGHGDVIRCVIHISEREQYVTASWDKTVRVWNAYKHDKEIIT